MAVILFDKPFCYLLLETLKLWKLGTVVVRLDLIIKYFEPEKWMCVWR